MKIKSIIRYYLGLIFSKGLAKKYANLIFKKLNILILSTLFYQDKYVLNIWFRRGVLRDDFIIFWSDLDLTILVDKISQTDLIEFRKKIKFLKKLLPWIQDIEVINSDFFQLWQLFGGLRASKFYEFKSIFPLRKFQIYTDYPRNSSQLNFDRAWEFRFLLSQFLHLNEKFRLNKFEIFDFITLRKISADIIKLYQETIHNVEIHSREQALKTNFKSIFFSNCSNIIKSQDKLELKNVFSFINSKNKELIEYFISYFPQLFKTATELFSLSDYDENYHVIHFGLPVYVKEKNNLFLPNNEILYITHNEFLFLKMIGSQEHDCILRNMKELDFLKNFTLQRLQQDYIQAITIDIDQHILHYCRLNIAKFINNDLVAKNLEPHSEIDEMKFYFDFYHLLRATFN